ncbi:MAG: ECF transporter S component [Clostridia bacterium]|nr:ECF transporter S component [Clostridia bacterium]
MKKIHRIVISSMFATLVCVATMMIKLPTPLGGYINLGDCIVLLCGWTLGPVYAFFAAAIGSALADIFSGYAFYAPATFVIKGSMALLVHFIFKLLSKRVNSFVSRLVGGIGAEMVMVVGYLFFEGFFYGLLPSLVNVPANAIQGVAGIIIGMLFITLLDKQNVLKFLK